MPAAKLGTNPNFKRTEPLQGMNHLTPSVIVVAFFFLTTSAFEQKCKQSDSQHSCSRANKEKNRCPPKYKRHRQRDGANQSDLRLS